MTYKGYQKGWVAFIGGVLQPALLALGFHVELEPELQMTAATVLAVATAWGVKTFANIS